MFKEILQYYRYVPALAALLFLFILTIRSIFKNRPLFKSKPSLYLLPVLAVGILAVLSYLLSKGILSEYFFRESLKKNTVSEMYELQRKAIIINPYIESYRVRFSQTNLVIANSLLDKSKQPSAEEKQTAAKAVQAAIEEAKAAVQLNDKRASNWANLGDIYKNLLNIAENSDTWAISAYQRAIVLDPGNAEYHFELGGIYYLLKDYDQAVRSFAAAKQLKPDSANIYYNLAWTYYRQGKSDLAITNMQTTISLLSAQNNSRELQKAQQDLEQFKN